MTLTRKEQSNLLDLLSKGFENVKHHNPGAWEGWQNVVTKKICFCERL